MDKQVPPPADLGAKPEPAKSPALLSAPARAQALYNGLFPPDSPQRKFGPLAIVAAVLIVLLLAKCAVSAAGEKISVASQARADAMRVRTTGVLIVKSNRPEATVEATLVAPAGSPAPEPVKGALGQSLASLVPGKYVVTLRAAGWSDARGEVEVPAGQQTELTVNFTGGSLRLESDPSGAVVKLAGAVLGKTPLTIPSLPPGNVLLSLEYPAWPAMPYTALITANQEAAANVRLPYGKLLVESIPAGATVLLGKQTLGRTPLTIERMSPGAKKLVLQAKDFPPLEASITVADGETATLRPVLGLAFPLLDPAELLRAVWLPDDSKVPRATTGIYRPKNDVVKNIRREWLYNQWLRKIYRISGPIKSYDAASGRLEFAEQKFELARYRVLAQLKPGTSLDRPTPPKGTPLSVTLYGRLASVEEPTWPGRVITLELTDTDFLPEAP